MAIDTVKQKILQVVKELPESATFEDAIERRCFLARVEEGIRQSDAGETVPHMDVGRKDSKRQGGRLTESGKRVVCSCRISRP
jgi:predicted transcriptional regulator